jgi:hypothetical protein
MEKNKQPAEVEYGIDKWEQWRAWFSIGVQKFHLQNAEDKKNAEWYVEMLKKAFANLSGSNELVQENEQLRRWKMEAAELLTKINSYAHKHLEIKLGQCAVEFTIARAKERDALKERCDKMEQLLKYARDTTHIESFAKRINEALKEGESNTPALGEGENKIVVHDNSDAFRNWITDVKGYEISLLGHFTGVSLPIGVTSEILAKEWHEYEAANNPKYNQ